MDTCPVCDGTGTEHRPGSAGSIITGWCSLCSGQGTVTPEQLQEAMRQDHNEQEDPHGS